MNVLLGVSGGVAAYKMLSVASMLIKEGHAVEVCMTNGATKFITPLAFEAIIHRKVVLNDSDFLHGCANQHIELAKWSDIMIIAPATANTIAKLSHGIADNIVTLTALANNKLKIVMPAMNNIMYEAQITQENIKKLEKLENYIVIEPEVGTLACGTIGRGRLLEPNNIVEIINFYINASNKLEGKNVLINAGATKEDIDPIRYITNRSSGKMGYAIASQAAQMGANVTLVTSSELGIPYGIKKVINVRSAKDMGNEMLKELDYNDIIICAAAVADYRTKEILNNKMKKKDEDLNLSLVRTQDILFEIGQKKNSKTLVGFAMETQNLIENAKLKLNKKNLDLIVANAVSDDNKVFNQENNNVTIIGNDFEEKISGSKNYIAKKILEAVIDVRFK